MRRKYDDNEYNKRGRGCGRKDPWSDRYGRTTQERLDIKLYETLSRYEQLKNKNNEKDLEIDF